MKDTTIKSIRFGIVLLVCNLIIVSSCDARPFKNIDELIAKESKTSSSSPSTSSVSKQPEKNIKIKKNKEGDFLVSWKVLAEYDTKKRKAGINLKKVIGKNINIKGFMIPLDYSEKKIKEFLLVPYMPSCAHVPPPPANMIINVKVKSKKGLKPSYYPVEISGKLEVLKASGKANPYMPEGIYSMVTSSITEVKR